ncbi:MAG: STAS domain-containing protein [Lachnospiraceae bacterium]|nr:STAS domain-containing protein [Lachnospiraceae bacterium]
MTVKKEKSDGVLTVSVEGSIDVKTAPELKEALNGELEDVMLVIIDLADTTYTSSAGLRVLLSIYQSMNRKGGRMKLTHMNDVFYNALKSAGYTQFLEIER